MTNVNTIVPQTAPRCPSCGRRCEPGITRPQVNYCRGLALLPYIEETPDSMAWELAQLSGMDYQDATKGLAKLREWGLVSFTSEEREAEWVRYRYSLADNPARRNQFAAACSGEGL